MQIIEYDGLLKKLEEKGICRTDLVSLLGISSRTIAKISRGEKLRKDTLKKIASFFSCDENELCRSVSDNHLLQILRDEKSIKLKGSIYHELQVRMTYNSNHIEGTRLTEDQTRLIFETNTITTDGYIPVDDIIETVNHFRAVDYVIDTAEYPLDEKIIKELHRILKQGTKDSTLSWFAVGDYKLRPSVVGGKETSRPKDVPQNMKNLLLEYNSIEAKTIEDIIAFHSEFEHIHPFQDGNGRVGRLIALKECLRFNIIPFIIEDSKKMFYYKGLSEWPGVKEYLIDTCLDGQDTFKELLSLFDITQ